MGFSFLIFGSFQFVIWPRKMFARALPVRWRWALIPGTLYDTTVAASAHGIWRTPLAFEAWSGVIGASLAPKSTVRAVICAIPAPLPIEPYVMPTPALDW